MSRSEKILQEFETAFAAKGEIEPRKIQEVLWQKTYNERPTTSYVVRSPLQANVAHRMGVFLLTLRTYCGDRAIWELEDSALPRLEKHFAREDSLVSDLYTQQKESIDNTPKKYRKKLIWGKSVISTMDDSSWKFFVTKTNEKLKALSPYDATWDPHQIGIYYSEYAGKKVESLKINLLPAVQAGLRYLINQGCFAIAITRPEVYLEDELGRLHCESGPAVSWIDEQFYFHRGVSVPAEWIEKKDSVDPKLCLNHPNVEQRRALCEILGWESASFDTHETIRIPKGDYKIRRQREATPEGWKRIED